MEQIILNLVPGGVSPVCYVSQYDVGRKIRLHLRNGSDPYVLSGAETINATIRKVSGEELIYDIANTSASYVDLIVNYDATDVIGESVCELIITESGLRIGSANFKMRIDPDVYSGNQKLEVVTASSPNSLLSFETNIDENLLEFKAGLSPIQNGTPWIDSNEVNKEPYIKRSVAGTASRIGNHLYDKLVGGTVAFNQHIDISSRTWTVNSMTVTANNGLLEISGTAGTTSSSSLVPAAIYNKTKPIYNHKYLLFAEGNHNFLALRFNIYGDTTQYAKEFSSQLASTIFICNVQNSTDAEFVASVRENMSYQASFKAFLVDLTAMFGSTIANYIYSLEQATAGAGVAWFKALFPNDYYAYNAGELMSVKATAHIMRNASNTVIGNYALDSNLELRGIPKLVNNKLEYDGDTYESNGNVTRKYGIVDLGSLVWVYTPQGFFSASLSGLKNTIDATKIPHLLCLHYVADTPSHVYSGIANKTTSTATGSSNLWIRDDAYTDATSFKTAMNGIMLIYEKETPTTEQASPFTNPQVCDENGTEEYTDNRAVAIPVGHETYQANICPINGYSSANITRCGVNLWDEETVKGTIESDGSIAPSASRLVTKNYVPIIGGLTYSMHIPYSLRGRGAFYDENYNLISYFGDFPQTSTPDVFPNNGSIYSTDDGYYFTFVAPVNALFMKYNMVVAYGTTYNNDISINYPSSDTAYHAYNGQTYAIAFGQTVYGGVLDVTRGKLTVTKKDLLFNGSESWQGYTTSSNTITFALTNAVSDILNQNDQISNMFTYNANAWDATRNLPNTFVLGASKTLFVQVSITDFPDTNSFKTFLSNNNLNVIYTCTPFDIDLTPVQISAIVGVNNLTHDANGGTEVKFFRLIPAS